MAALPSSERNFLRAAYDANLAQLEGFEYQSPEELADAKSRFEEITKDLRNAFLSATMPELNALVKHLNDLLRQFFTVELPPATGELARSRQIGSGLVRRATLRYDDTWPK